MKKIATLALAAALSCAASAQETPVSIALSGWTGFAPLTLAKEAGIFKKNDTNRTKTFNGTENEPKIIPLSILPPLARVAVGWTTDSIQKNIQK